MCVLSSLIILFDRCNNALFPLDFFLFTLHLLFQKRTHMKENLSQTCLKSLCDFFFSVTYGIVVQANKMFLINYLTIYCPFLFFGSEDNMFHR